MDTLMQSSRESAKRSTYRHHRLDFKRSLVEQSLASGASVSVIAHQHDINANQLFAWRKLYKDGLLETQSKHHCQLLPVVLAQSPPSAAPSAATLDVATVPAGVIHLAAGKAQLRLEGQIDAATLTLVLQHLLG